VQYVAVVWAFLLVFVARLFEPCLLDEKMGVDGYFSSIVPVAAA
jgi:hypothetical protein